MTRAIQLIDSLNAGGAERLSVSLANTLVEEIDKSFLCATREEGILRDTIKDSVDYFFLEKKSSLDFKAILKLKKFIKRNKINVIHAHSTSYFLATLTKLLSPKTKLIWHDHYGESEFLEKRPKYILKFCSYFFNHIFCVNQHLLNWSQQNLNCKNVTYLKNFMALNDSNKTTELYGHKGKRILCLANLRPQKDHITLLKAFTGVVEKHTTWTLHCVGKDFKDDYSATITNFIANNNLDKKVFFYGSRSDVKFILEQSEIGVLSSKSEGLPIGLLEYAYGKLAVVVTDVGDCNLVINNKEKGLMVNPEDALALQDALLHYIENDNIRIASAQKLHDGVIMSFSKESVIKKVLNVYQY